MGQDNRIVWEPRGRLPGLVLAAAATVLVFAAINAGFTPHAAELAARELPARVMSL